MQVTKEKFDVVEPTLVETILVADVRPDAGDVVSVSRTISHSEASGADAAGLVVTMESSMSAMPFTDGDIVVRTSAGAVSTDISAFAGFSATTVGDTRRIQLSIGTLSLGAEIELTERYTVVGNIAPATVLPINSAVHYASIAPESTPGARVYDTLAPREVRSKPIEIGAILVERSGNRTDGPHLGLGESFVAEITVAFPEGISPAPPPRCAPCMRCSTAASLLLSTDFNPWRGVRRRSSSD